MLADSEMKGVAKKAPKKGMQLGKPKNKPNNAMIKELEKQQVISKQEVVANNEEEEQQPVYNALTENIQMDIDERVTCQITKDGDIEKFELKGIVYMTLTDVKKANPEILLNYEDFKGLVFKVHPELDKQAWNKQKMIKAKSADEGFSTQTRLDALRYRYTSKTEEDLPFTINVFNSKKAGKNVVTLELEFNQNQNNLKFQALENVTISLSMGDAGTEVDIELIKTNVNIETDTVNNVLLWHVANIHEADSAVLSFASKSLVFDDMFPLNVKFNEQYSLIDLQLQNAPLDATSGEEMSIKQTISMQTEGYKITSD